MLPLTSVVDILHAVHETGGDWSSALRQHIPRKKVKTAQEVNIRVREMVANRAAHNRAILQVLEERMVKQHQLACE
jgi:hypothetical protein